MPSGSETDGGLDRRSIVVANLSIRPAACARVAARLAVVWETINALQFFDIAWATKRGGPIDATTVIIFYGYKLGFVDGEQGLGAAVACVLFVAIVVLVLMQVGYARWRKLDVV